MVRPAILPLPLSIPNSDKSSTSPKSPNFFGAIRPDRPTDRPRCCRCARSPRSRGGGGLRRRSRRSHRASCSTHRARRTVATPPPWPPFPRALLEARARGRQRMAWEQQVYQLVVEGAMRRGYLLSLITAEALRDVGFTAAELLATGFILAELRVSAAIRPKSSSSVDLRQRRCGARASPHPNCGSTLE